MIIQADARALPLPDASVDLIVTSPPFYALRSYTDGGEHYEGQIGSEATPQEWLANLLDCTREMMRVLKPSGSIWVDLGDKYATGSSSPGAWSASSTLTGGLRRPPQQSRSISDGRAKSLMLLPERYRIACVDQLGLIARAVVVWNKPNGLPESVTDRVRRSHEDWVHLTKQPRYFSAVDEIREPYGPGTAARYRSGYKQDASDLARIGKGYDWSDTANGAMTTNPLGKLPGSVWTIPTEPLTVPEHLGVDHFAAFPTEWPRRIILGWSPSGICLECGEGRRPVMDKRYRSTAEGYSSAGRWGLKGQAHDTPLPSRLGDGAFVSITGYACACPEPTAPTRPAVVLDPFGGTGTTALVAQALGRVGISVDMSADYCQLARWRTSDPGERAKAMRVDKPAPVHRDQLDLFSVEAS